MPQFKKLTPNLLVANVERSLAFYVETLGFARGMTVPDASPFVFAAVTSGNVEIFFNDAATAVKIYRDALQSGSAKLSTAARALTVSSSPSFTPFSFGFVTWRKPMPNCVRAWTRRTGTSSPSAGVPSTAAIAPAKRSGRARAHAARCHRPWRDRF